MGRVKDQNIVPSQDVYNYLVQQKGLTDAHAKGMLANINAESGFRPSVTGDDGSSLGLFQHHLSRKDALLKHVNGDLTDWKGQIDYALSEAPTKKYLATKFNTPQEASYWFTTKWERPSDAHNKAIQRQKFLEGDIFTGSATDNKTATPLPTREAYVNPFNYSITGNSVENITKEQIEREMEKERIKNEEIKASDNLKKLEEDRAMKNNFIQTVTSTDFTTYVEPERSSIGQQMAQQQIAPVQFAPIQEGLSPL